MIRNTPQLRAVLRVMLEAPETPCYGYELVRRTGYQSGTVNVLLERLAKEGLVSQAWEQIDPSVVGRPLRRYSRLTVEGVAVARAKLDEWEGKRRP